MILYHGSNVKVLTPQIIKSEYGKDFGFAFYLTPIKEQAERMAIRKTKIEGCGAPTISIFNWDEDISKLKYKKFSFANEEWLDFVINCRSDIKFRHPYDIVEGKIADDNVGATITYVLSNIMRKEDAIKRLSFQKINSQIAFCTDRSLSSLSFVRSYKI